MQPGRAITTDESIPVPPVPFSIYTEDWSKHGGISARAGSLRSGGSMGRPSGETLPPAYYKLWESSDMNTIGVVDGTERARSLWSNHQIAKKGSWRGLVLPLTIAAILAILLGVGLGVGLVERDKKSSRGTMEAKPTMAPLGFPIGEYSLNTALERVQTNCTSNSATWRCYPYSSYSTNSTSSASSSLAIFNWALTNTSTTYMSNASLPSTTAAGIPANLTITASYNAFSSPFANESLTYINDADNPRYTFSYTMTQKIIPTTSLTTDNAAAVCFYNTTLLTGTLYLSSAPATAVDFPPPGLANSTLLGGYTAWPFAARVEQVVDGGADVPACYKTSNGNLGAPITDGFTGEPSSAECICEWANYAT